MISAAKVEHYEIATYGTLRVYAVTLGETKPLAAKHLKKRKMLT
jgi:ferritin-like metal-binding protein YciE